MLVTVLEDNYQMQGINRSIETVIQYIRNPSDKVKELLTRIHETEDKEQRNALKMWIMSSVCCGIDRISTGEAWLFLRPTIYQVSYYSFCDPGGARTHDSLVKSQVLYQLSYEIFFI